MQNVPKSDRQSISKKIEDALLSIRISGEKHFESTALRQAGKFSTIVVKYIMYWGISNKRLHKIESCFMIILCERTGQKPWPPKHYAKKTH